MRFFENPAVFGDALHSFFPEAIVPKDVSVQEALEQLALHQNPGYADMANRLLAICEHYHTPDSQPKPMINTSDDVYHYFSKHPERVTGRTTALLFGPNKELKSVVRTSSGMLEEKYNCLREVIRNALMHRASHLIAFQYRPEGVHAFNEDERLAAGLLREYSFTMRMRVLDYLVIGDDSYFSSSANKRFTPGQPETRSPMKYW